MSAERYEKDLARLKDPSLTPSERLSLWADTVVRMADDLQKTAQELTEHDRRFHSEPVREDRREHPR